MFSTIFQILDQKIHDHLQKWQKKKGFLYIFLPIGQKYRELKIANDTRVIYNMATSCL